MAGEAKAKEFQGTDERIFPHKGEPMLYETHSGTEIAEKLRERKKAKEEKRLAKRERRNVIKKKMFELQTEIAKEKEARTELEAEINALKRGETYVKPVKFVEEGWFNKSTGKR